MEFKQVIDQFKNEHIADGESLLISKLPILVNNLKVSGLNRTQATAQYYVSLVSYLCPSDVKKVQLMIVENLLFLSRVLALPKEETEPVNEVKKEKLVVKKEIALKGNQAIEREDGGLSTEHLVIDIPKEEDEGDPFFVPEDQRLTLKREDIKPMQYDQEICDMIGYKIPGEGQ